MLLNIIKAFLIGICASVPLGPTAIYILQVSLSKGHKPGFFTGLGATTMDTLYATMAIFALAFAEEFLATHNTLILIVGGLVVAMVGASVVFSNPFRRVSAEENPTYSIRDYLHAVALALSNPTAIVVMFTLFAFFGVRLSEQAFKVAPIIIAVAAGSASYWFCFSGLFGYLRHNFKISTLVWINKIAGVIVMIVGIALLAEGLMKQFVTNIV